MLKPPLLPAEFVRSNMSYDLDADRRGYTLAMFRCLFWLPPSSVVENHPTTPLRVVLYRKEIPKYQRNLYLQPLQQVQNECSHHSRYKGSSAGRRELCMLYIGREGLLKPGS